MDTATTLVDQIRRLWFFQSDHHAEMWKNKAGEIGYSPACDHRFQKEVCDYHCDTCAHKAPTALTDERIKAHLAGKKTLGAYQLREGRAGWLCLDVDANKDTEQAHHNVKEIVRLLRGKLERMGLPVYVEFTGNKGFHLWVFCPDGALAKDLQRLGQWIVNDIAEEHGEYADTHIEVFPKQGNPQPYGNLVKVPLGVHLKTSNRCLFVDETLSPIADQSAYVLGIQTVTAQEIAKVIDEWLPEVAEIPGEPPARSNGRGKLSRATIEFIKAGADEGERNNRLFSTACDMRGNNIPAETIMELLLPMALESGLPERESRRTIESACSKERVPAVPQQQAVEGEEQDEPYYKLVDNCIIYSQPKPIYSHGRFVTMDWRDTRVTNFSAQLTKEVVERDGNEFSSVYTIEGYSDRPFLVEVGAEDFRDERKCRGRIGAAAGANAIIYSPKHLPIGIQSLSGGYSVDVRYKSTGWQMVDNHLEFLTPGTSSNCRVSFQLHRYDVHNGDVPAGIDALLNGLLKAFPPNITYPAVAHAFLAPLYHWMTSAKRYALHFVGETGSLKTSYACALLALFGPEFVNEEPPVKWGSTWKMIEVVGHEAKDVLFLADDYKPRLVPITNFMQVIHNYSDGSGRGRLNRDSTVQETKYIRGALLTTGEDLPQGEASVAARLLILHFQRQHGVNEPLAYAQQQASHLNAAMFAYIRWLAETMPGKEAELDAYLIEQRDRFVRMASHNATNAGRVATNLAQNRLAWDTMGRWLVSRGVWSETERERRLAEYDEIALGIIQVMAQYIDEEKASAAFLRALKALLDSGQAVLLEKSKPDQDPTDRRIMLGWRDDDYVYLLRDVAYHAVETWYAAEKKGLGFGMSAVEEQLIADGLLRPGAATDTHTTTTRIGSKTKRVLRLVPMALEDAPEPEQEEMEITDEEIPF
jgi:hypothetical protein